MVSYKTEVHKINFTIENDEYDVLAEGTFTVTVDCDSMFEEYDDDEISVIKYEKYDEDFRFDKDDIQYLLESGSIEYDVACDDMTINAEDLQ